MDGTAAFMQKTYDSKGGSARNAAVLRFSEKGIQFAVNTGSATTPSEAMYKELATQEYVDQKIKEYLIQAGVLPDIPTSLGLEYDENEDIYPYIEEVE